MVKEDVAWQNCDPEDLWVFDKLILAKKLGYLAGPKGVDVPKPGLYIVRPCVNVVGMGVGADIRYLSGETDDTIPTGYFWSEIFVGRHLSIDYVDGKQTLAVQGFRSPNNPLWKWSRWKAVSDIVPLPPILKPLALKYRYMNIEMIGGRLIEAHLRLNPDWTDKDIIEMIPVFRGDKIVVSDEYKYVENKDFLREGFYVRRKNG